MSYTPEEIKTRLLALKGNLQIRDIAEAVVGGPVNYSMLPYIILTLANIVAGVDLRENTNHDLQTHTATAGDRR